MREPPRASMLASTSKEREIKETAVFRKHISYSNVMATIAVFAVLGGTAVAAGKIRTANIANNAVTAKKLAPNAASSATIADGAVARGDLADGQVTKADIADEAVTASKLGKVEYRGSIVTVDGGAATIASCKAGERLIGGGATIEGEDNVQDGGSYVAESGPSADRTSWVGRAFDSDAAADTLTVTAICLAA
jgi:hypothetical protein